MNLFENGFEEPGYDFPNKVLSDATQDFGKATDELVRLNIVPNQMIEQAILGTVKTKFQYRVVVSSSRLKGYSFNVANFGYDVSLYPTYVQMESEIAAELDIDYDVTRGHCIRCNDENQFLEAFAKIFNTDKFKKTVGGLLKIARSKVD